MSHNFRKVYLYFYTREKFYAMPEIKLPKPLATRNSMADKRSPCKFLKFFFFAINYFEANTSLMEITLNIKDT